MSIGINMTSIAMKICGAEPEYHIIRDKEANTAVSSVARTLAHESRGETANVKIASQISLFGALSISPPHLSVIISFSKRNIPSKSSPS